MKRMKAAGATVVLALGIGLAAALASGVRIGDAVIGLAGPSPRSILLEMGLPDRATDVSAFDTANEDGNRPAAAWRSFAVPAGTEAAVRAFYRGRCDAVGLERREPIAIMPALFCERPGGGTTFHLTLRCDAHCRVFTEIRRIGG